MTDRSAKKQLSPTQYARFCTSGARYAQRSRLKQLEKQSKKAEERTRKFLHDNAHVLDIKYDAIVKTYTVN